MSAEVRKIIDKWYDEYCKANNVAPTWSELLAKAAEVEVSLKNKEV